MYLLSSDNMFLFRLFGSTGYCAACKKIIPAFEMVRINDDDDDDDDDDDNDDMTGDEGEEQRVPPGVLRVSGVRTQVLCGGPVLPAR